MLHPFALLGLLLPACGPDERSDRPTRLGNEPAEVVDAQFGVAERAVILVLDGVRLEESFGDGESDAWGGPTEEILPNIRRDLRHQGGVAEPAYVTGTTFTASSHADMVTGVRQYYANMGASEGYGLRRPDHPTIFEQLRLERDLLEEQVVLAANTTILGDLNHGYAPGYGLELAGDYVSVTAGGEGSANAHRDAAVVNRVKASLDDDGAIFALANLHQIDRAGHANSFEYADYVSDVDGPVVAFWRALRDQAQHGDDLPLVVILSDHGRHRFLDTDDPWRDHGCSCSGCREVPLLIMGPGIEPGTVATRPYLLEDVTHTVAWLMGVSMPYSTGLALDEFLAGSAEVPVRDGEVALAADGELLAWQRWELAHGARSSVVVDDETLSRGVLHVEQPTVARAKDADYACWRELVLAEGAKSWPWRARCSRRSRSGVWEDMGLETDVLPDGFEAGLQVDDDDRLWVLYLGGERENGMDAITPSTVGYQLARWDDALGSWESSTELQELGRFPSHARLRMVDGQALVAAIRSDDEATMRYSRHLVVFEVDWPRGEEPTWLAKRSFRPADSDNTDIGRVERPALGVAGEDLAVAVVGYSDDATFLMVASQESTQGHGQTWSELRTLDDSGLVYPHLSAAFSDDGWLYWARQAGSGGVEICRVSDVLAAPSCRDTGYGWIDSLAPADGGTWASLSDGDLSWNRVWVPF